MTTIFSKQSAAADTDVHPGKYTKTHVLTSFALKPKNVRFETQEPHETVELFLRQHPIVTIPWLLITALLVIAPTILFPIIFHALPFGFPAGYIVVITAFWYVATFGFFLTNFLHWFFNIYIVTNERIVDIDFKFLLYKHFSQAELGKIQDLSFVSSGIGATLFNYGNVHVQTAGELPTIEFDTVPHPQKVVEIIRDLAEKVRQS